MILYNSTDPLTFTFAKPVNTFAIKFKDLDLTSFGGLFQYSIDGGPRQTLLAAGGGDNLLYFFGLIDPAATFTTILFDRTGGDGYQFDLVRFGVVPKEPSSVLLSMLGSCAYCFTAPACD